MPSRFTGATVLAFALLKPDIHLQARAQTSDGTAPTCFLTAGGTLEICREGNEAEGVFFTPRPCEFARNVQILRLASSERPGPIQVVYQGETPAEAPRRGDSCGNRRALDPADGGSVRSGRSPEQLAAAMPPTGYRLWEMTRAVRRPDPPRRTRKGQAKEPVPATGPEGIAARNPILVAGRDWAGEEYYHLFLIATAGAQGGNRRVQIQARTYDFEHFEIRSRGPEGYGTVWTPFEPDAPKGRGRVPPPSPTAVLDEAGKPLVGNCPGEGFDTQGLNGSISVVDQTYHYFYTDVLPEDCAEPAAKRRDALYLRTSRDLGADRVWSGARVLATLPAGSFVRVGRAKGMERWALSYACRRPANAPGGPAPDICVQYTADLSIGAIAGLIFYADPVEAQRSPAYLGLRSGGDGSGRYGRAAHYWMTDRYGNLDTPASFPGKAGFLTWLDRLAPRADGSEASSLYGRPVYWATWSVRPVGPK